MLIEYVNYSANKKSDILCFSQLRSRTDIRGKDCYETELYSHLLFDDLINTRTMPLNDWVQMARKLNLDALRCINPTLVKSSKTRIPCSAYLTWSFIKVWKYQCLPAMQTFPTWIHRKRTPDGFYSLGCWRRCYFPNQHCASYSRQMAWRAKHRRYSNVCWQRAWKQVWTMLMIKVSYSLWKDHPEVGTRIADFMRILELVDDGRLKVNLDTSNRWKLAMTR